MASIEEARRKWNWWVWFIGNSFGISLFGKMAFLAFQQGDHAGGWLMAGIVGVQLVTTFIPWLRRQSFNPARAAVVHLSLLTCLSALGYYYTQVSSTPFDEKTRLDVSRCPWVVGAILGVLLLALAIDRMKSGTADSNQEAKPSPPVP